MTLSEILCENTFRRSAFVELEYHDLRTPVIGEHEGIF